MSHWRFVVRSLKHHLRLHIAVALAVAATTAVLTGALLVGDSVRGSLRGLTLDRLGRIDALLMSDQFFRRELAEQLASDPQVEARYGNVTPAMLFPQATVEFSAGDGTSRANQVLLVGCDESFWSFDTAGVKPRQMPAEGEIVLNAALAAELHAVTGDEVVIRLPKAANIPADSPLGEKEDRVRGIPGLRVVDVVPSEGLGRFSLTASQTLPTAAFVHPDTLAAPLAQEGRANAILISARDRRDRIKLADCTALDRRLRPQLSDVGLAINRVRLAYSSADAEQPQEIFDYFSFTSSRMVIDDATAKIAEQTFAADHAQPVMTYLANAIQKAESDPQDQNAGIPYSTVAAVDSVPQLGPLRDEAGELIELADDEIVLNSWAADDLGVTVGDKIRLVYFEPETTHGANQETFAEFTLRGIAQLTEPIKKYEDGEPPVFGDPPTLVNDANLTPEVAGITDQDSISRWKTPFELTRRVRRKDDVYHGNHRLTPKAFVALQTGQRLWGSRFGNTTSFRLPAPDNLPLSQTDAKIAQLEEKFLNQAGRDEANLGLAFRPIKDEALNAASGTTPFDVLFLSLSFFIIAAALMLVFLLFRLGVETRADEAGMLSAFGISEKQVRKLFSGEVSSSLLSAEFSARRWE